MRAPAALLVLLVCTPAAAQQPRVSNANLQARAVSGGLERDFRAIVGAQRSAAWIGYAVPMIPGEHSMCCYGSNECCRGCALERGSASGTTAAAGDRTVRLEGPRSLFVLYRIEQGKVDKIRTFSEECELDAGGLEFHWLTGVRPSESVALLASYASSESAEGKEGRRLSDGAVAAIAFHNDAAADGALEQLVAAGAPDALRERAAFWLGNARGRRGYEVLRRIVREDASDRVREKAIFALTQSREPEAVGAIIDTARSDKSARVRGQALFWLAQKAGKKAAEAITDAIANDPETEVKRKAVFALSQLPKDEGVPMLIQVARTHKNPEVRKQAMFWLGQSRDARALAFFEEVLR
jgi:HEAT repeat protein